MQIFRSPFPSFCTRFWRYELSDDIDGSRSGSARILNDMDDSFE